MIISGPLDHPSGLTRPPDSGFIEEDLCSHFHASFWACKFRWKGGPLQLQFQINLIGMTEILESQLSPCCPSRTKRSSYAKISLKTKLIFFQKVVKERANLRQVAKKLGIKYSTAKTLLRNYKRIYELEDKELVRTICLDFNNKKLAKKRCGYASIDERMAEVSAEGSSQCCMRQTGPFAFNRIEIISNSFPIRKR